MKRIKAAFYVFYKSLFSPAYYAEVVTTRFSFSVKYFAVLALVASVATFLSVAPSLLNDMRSAIDTFEQTAVEAYPEDLVVTLQSGELSINQPEPYIFKMPEGADMQLDEADQEATPLENAVVFDSQGTLDDLERYNTLFLVNKTNILVRNANKVEVYPLRDYPDGQLTHEKVQQFTQEVRPVVNALPYVVLAFALLGTLVYYFGFRLFYLIFVAAVLWGVSRIRRLGLTYMQNYKVAIHSLTLPLIIEVLADVTEFAINLPYWFLALNLLMGFLGLLSVGRPGTAKQVDRAGVQQ